MRTNHLGDYRKESKPPKSRSKGLAGEPIITANVTKVPKTIPTSINRLFIPIILHIPVKNGLYQDLEKIWKNALKEKLYF